MSEGKNCPLLACPDGDTLLKFECDEINCGWWDNQNKQCSMVTLAQGFTILSAILHDIYLSMPKER